MPVQIAVTRAGDSACPVSTAPGRNAKTTTVMIPML